MRAELWSLERGSSRAAKLNCIWRYESNGLDLLDGLTRIAAAYEIEHRMEPHANQSLQKTTLIVWEDNIE